MAKSDNNDNELADRPSGVSELAWQARLAYQAVQAERAKHPEQLTTTDTKARDAANAVLSEGG